MLNVNACMPARARTLRFYSSHLLDCPRYILPGTLQETKLSGDLFTFTFSVLKIGWNEERKGKRDEAD